MSQREYIFLDGDAERQQLIDELARVRADFERFIDALPESEWYTPRYHGWSPAAMWGHLNWIDTLSLWVIKAALLGIRPQLSMNTVNMMNDFTARLFQKRLIEASRKGTHKQLKNLEGFIMQLPMSRFSTPLYSPPAGQMTTVERALQDFFLFHWQTHLNEMRETEGIERPSQSTDWT